MKRWLSRLATSSLRIAAGFVLITMPIGYYRGDPDSADAAIAIHGGFGQAGYTLYSCFGGTELIDKGSARFRDISGTVYTSLNPRHNSAYVLSVSAGSWEAYTGFPKAVWPDTVPYIPTYTYVIPVLSIETEMIGFGLGPVFGDVPGEFGDYRKPSNEPLQTRIRFAGKLRCGNPDKAALSIALLSNSPLASGGGFFDITLSGPMDRKRHVMTSWGVSIGSIGLYDKVGFLQQTRVRLSPNLDIDFAGRIGGAEGITEYGLSGGLVFYPWPRSSHSPSRDTSDTWWRIQ